MLNPNCSAIVTRLTIRSIEELRAVLARLFELVDDVGLFLKIWSRSDHRDIFIPLELDYLNFVEDLEDPDYPDVKFDLSGLPVSISPELLSDDAPQVVVLDTRGIIETYGLGVKYDAMNKTAYFRFMTDMWPSGGFLAAELIHHFNAEIDGRRTEQSTGDFLAYVREHKNAHWFGRRGEAGEEE